MSKKNCPGQSKETEMTLFKITGMGKEITLIFAETKGGIVFKCWDKQVEDN